MPDTYDAARFRALAKAATHYAGHEPSEHCIYCDIRDGLLAAAEQAERLQRVEADGGRLR